MSLERGFDARGELRGPALFRVCAGPLVAMHLWPFLRDALHGHYYRDSFYVPWFAHYPELSLPAYTALLWLGMLGALVLSLGFGARAASWLCTAIVFYNFFLSETFFHHNRTFLLVFLAGLSLTDATDSLSIDAHLRRTPPPPRPLWPLWLWRVEACVPYLASSTSKLLDPDWFAGIVTWDRVVRHAHEVQAWVPSSLLTLAQNQALHAWLAKSVIALELSVGIGLWFGRTRYLAVWLAVLFHALIQVTARIQVFSVLGIAGLAIWVTPITRDRTLQLRLDQPTARSLARWLPRLDWLARFRIATVMHGPAVTLIDRDGRLFTGRQALLQILARLPLTAFVALPAIGFDLWRARAPSTSTQRT
jgi:hypothetical protein